jgi:hypothetical protein
MDEALAAHFSSVFGQPGQAGLSVDFEGFGYGQVDLSTLDAPFNVDEVWAAINDMPADRAPGPDGTAWEVIKDDIMAALNCVLHGDGRAFHLLNNALIVLIPKKPDAATPADKLPELIPKRLHPRSYNP